MSNRTARSSPAIRYQVIFDIRDARGLSSYEKAFLWCVESRGIMFTSAKRAQADMGLTKPTFYRVRKRLVDRGLLQYKLSKQGPTSYRVVAEKVRARVPKDDAGEGDEGDWMGAVVSPSETSAFAVETPKSQSGHRDASSGDAEVSEGGPEGHRKETVEGDTQGSSEVGQDEEKDRNPTLAATELNLPNRICVHNLIDQVKSTSPHVLAKLRASLQRWNELAISGAGNEQAEIATTIQILRTVLVGSGLETLPADAQQEIMTFVWSSVLNEKIRRQVQGIFAEDDAELMVALGLYAMLHGPLLADSTSNWSDTSQQRAIPPR